jgi:oligopeptide transport system substrate-binding protein
MQDNRTKWLIALGALVGLCAISLVCVVIVGLTAFQGYFTTTEITTMPAEPGVVEGEQPGPRDQPAARRGSNELVLLGADPPTLDPALTTDATSANYIVEMFSGLVTLNMELETVPDIAQEWVVSEDGTVYTFNLRDDTRFADGREVTAEDFKYSWERACAPATQSPVADTYLGDIVGCREKLRGESDEVTGVRVVDAYTLEVTIDAPKVYFLSKLTYPTAFVVDRETIEREGRLWASVNPNGTGPFTLAQYTFGERLVLVPNQNYYGSPAPSVERVTYILSGGSGMTMYETDEIDMVGVGQADIDRVLDPSSPLHNDVREVENLSIGYIGLNSDAPPFDDPLVRQAFTMAIDKQALAEVVLGDRVSPAYGILPTGMPGHNPDLEGLRYDPEQAWALLEQSSYGGPEALPDITFHVVGGGGSAGPETEAIVEMWRQNLGVEVALEQTEWATFLFDINQRPNPYPLFSLGWIADYPDPENFLDLHFHCDSTYNQTGYCNREVDTLLEEARVEQDEERRMELYQEVEQIVVSESPWIPLWFGRGHVLVKPWVQNYHFPPTIVPTLQYVEIEH